MVNSRTGQPSFYDINTLSNFVADAPNLVGFDPFVNLVDYIVERAVDPEAETARPERQIASSAT